MVLSTSGGRIWTHTGPRFRSSNRNAGDGTTSPDRHPTRTGRSRHHSVAPRDRCLPTPRHHPRSNAMPRTASTRSRGRCSRHRIELVNPIGLPADGDEAEQLRRAPGKDLPQLDPEFVVLASHLAVIANRADHDRRGWCHALGGRSTARRRPADSSARLGVQPATGPSRHPWSVTTRQPCGVTTTTSPVKQQIEPHAHSNV